MIPDKSVADLISVLVSDGNLQREVTASVLNDYPVEEVLSALSGVLRSPDKSVRNRTMELFTYIGQDAVPTLGALLADDEWVIRYRAAEALGIIGGDVACGLLVPALHDEKDHVRYMAAKGLGQTVYAGAADGVAALLNDENEFVRASSARALGQICCVEYVPHIEAALKREEYDKTRIAMEEALSCLNGQ
jgi:HEAT repeat protein